MTDLQAPIINYQVRAGDSEAGFSDQNVLIIAQGAGSNPSLNLIEDIQSTEVESLLGTKANSFARLAYDKFREHNRATNLDMITVTAPLVGTAGEGAISVVGTATENKVLTIRLYDDSIKVKVTIASGDDSEAVSSKISEAINASGTIFGASVDENPADSDNDSLVKITTSIRGTHVNKSVPVIEGRVLGLSLTAVKHSGGAAVYVTDGIFDNITKRYQTVIFDRSVDFDVVETWLEGRFNTSNTVKGGSGFTVMNGSISDQKEFAATKNSKTMTVFANVDEMRINAIPILALAEFAAKRALRLTDGAVLGDLVVEAQESFGGVSKSSLPYHNTPMSYDQPLNQITIEQVTDLNNSGLSLIVPATPGTVLGSVTTLYKTDNTGIADGTFKYLNAVDTSLAIQEYLFNNSQKEFGQTRATTGNLVAGVAMTNALSVKSFIVGLYVSMADLALVQGGADAVKAFRNRLTVTLDATTGVYAVYAPVAIVSQFRGLNGVVAISYNFR